MKQEMGAIYIHHFVGLPFLTLITEVSCSQGAQDLESGNPMSKGKKAVVHRKAARKQSRRVR